MSKLMMLLMLMMMLLLLLLFLMLMLLLLLFQSEPRLIKYFRESPLQLLLLSASLRLPPQKLSHTASVAPVASDYDAAAAAAVASAAICHETTHTMDTTTPRKVLEGTECFQVANVACLHAQPICRTTSRHHSQDPSCCTTSRHHSHH